MTDVDFKTVLMMASALVHYEERLASGGLPLDQEVAESCMRNPDVEALMSELDQNGFLPIRRDGKRYKR